MADTNWIPSQRSSRASMLGGIVGQGVSQGLENIVMNMAHQKAQRMNAPHIQTLNSPLNEPESSGLNQLQSPHAQPIPNNNPDKMDIKPIDFLKALAPLGLQMTPQQEKHLSSLTEDQQDKIADQVFRSLGPQQREQLQNHWMGKQSPQDNMQSEVQKPQQVIGSQQPGIAPQQPNRIVDAFIPPSDIVPEKRSLSQDLAREKFESAQEEKQQKRIKSENAPFVKQLEKEVPIAEKTLRLVNEMLELEAKGETPENVISRSAGAYLPGVINPYAEYNAKSNEIAALKSQATGRPSVFMTQLQQSTKPNSSMPKDKRINLLNSLKDNAEVIIGVEEAARSIVEENNGKQIPNLKKHAEEKFFNGILPNPSDYEVNTEVEIYGEKFKNSPKGWTKVGKGK